MRESQRRRYARVEDVDDVIAMDAKWRDTRWELDNVNQEFNKANKEVSKLKVAKENADEAMAKVKEIDARRKQLEEEEKVAPAYGSIQNENAAHRRVGKTVHASRQLSESR